MSSARPSPKKSALAGLSPLTPPTDGDWSARKNSGQRSPSKFDGKAKLTISIDGDLAGRARNAYWATSHVTGVRSLSDWIADAIQRKLTEVELEHNGGEPFPPLDAGQIPTGRRTTALGGDHAT